ncbi:MAG TPA: ABC transporter family substrate-binding protein [Jatrophihabitantaceae bacterium]|nr:ABC transporter family substrate-binding protein [Jatrophihabitantaceae bacterium]
MSVGMRAGAAIIATGLCLTLVAGCGGGASKSGVGTAPSQTTSNAVNQMVATPRADMKSGGSMTWALSQTIPNFNYYEVDGTLQDNTYVLNALLPNPFHFDAAGNPTVDTDYFSSIVQKSSSPLVIEYTINPKATWSDGTRISWVDLASLWRASSGANPAFDISADTGYNQIRSVTAGANAQQAVVTFSKPFTDWQGLFSPLVPRTLTATPAAFNTGWTDHPLVTAGPFNWGSQDKTAQTYTVVRNPKWWGDPAELNKIVFAAYDDPSAAVQALGTHEVDYDDISLGDTAGNIAAAKSYSGIDIRQAPGNNYRQFTFNTKDPLLSDLKVRQAILLGIDRAKITTALIGRLGGNPTPLDNNLFMKNQAAYAATCGSYCAYNPGQAKQLLESDEWTLVGGTFEKGGKPLTLTITIPASTPNATSEAEVAQNSLAAAGIKLAISSVPTNDFFSKYIDAGKFQLTTFTWIGTSFPVGGALSIFKYDPSSVGQNYGSGGSDEINALLGEAASAPNAKAEAVLANRASQAMWANAAWLPLYQRPQIVAANSKLVNIGAPGFADIRYQDVGYVS